MGTPLRAGSTLVLGMRLMADSDENKPHASEWGCFAIPALTSRDHRVDA